MDLFEHIYRKLNPYADNRPGGFLVVPETLTQEEWMAQAEKHNATARDPSLPREPDAETEAAAAVAEMKRKLVLAEVEKARQGLPSPLGHAMLAYERKWRESYDPVR